MAREDFERFRAMVLEDDVLADTPVLARCGYFREVLGAFQCPLTSVRLLKLGAGARIREHRDYRFGFEDGELRIHAAPLTRCASGCAGASASSRGAARASGWTGG